MVTYAVSIHAPLRGATWSARVFCNSYCCFNPRPPAGCDAHRGAGRAPRSLFQSTHPCGVRPSSSSASSARIGFNPRTPAGCDPDVSVIGALHEVFQSTHPCGVRLPELLITIAPASFQSTHPCGVRRTPSCHQRLRPCVSIHAPLRGATRYHTGAVVVHCQVSIHAPLRGATVECDHCGRLTPVSIHAPLRGATERKLPVMRSRLFQSTHPCGVRRT